MQDAQNAGSKDEKEIGHGLFNKIPVGKIISGIVILAIAIPYLNSWEEKKETLKKAVDDFRKQWDGSVNVDDVSTESYQVNGEGNQCESVGSGKSSHRSKCKLLHEINLSDCVEGEIYELRMYEICMQQENLYTTVCLNFDSPGQGTSFFLRSKKKYCLGDMIKDGTKVRYDGVLEVYGIRRRAFTEISE